MSIKILKLFLVGVCGTVFFYSNTAFGGALQQLETISGGHVSNSYSGSSGSSFETQIMGNIFGSLLNSILAPPSDTSVQDEINRQNAIKQQQAAIAAEQLKEQQRQEFLRSNTAFVGKLKGHGTTYVEDNNISTTGGLKLKSISPDAPSVSSSGDTHTAFFGQPGSAQPTVALLREEMAGSGNGLLERDEYLQAVSNPDLTQEERERLQLRTHVSLAHDPNDWMLDSRALVEKEKYVDPYLDIALAAAKGGAASVGISLTEEGGKQFLKIIGEKNTGFDELLSLGKAGVEPPKNTAETIVMVGDYALTKAPLWAVAVDGAANAVGAGTRQAIVRFGWASEDSKYYDPRPMETRQKEWDDWYADQNQGVKAFLNRIGAGKF